MNKLMCHVVAGYPDAKTCLDLMQGLDKIGVSAIEVQIPFSDPIADGETIMRANDVALEKGMTTAGSFKLVREAGVACDVYVMSYLQKVQHFGIEEFCDEASTCGANGLIIPDLPYDSPEYAELADRAKALNLRLVPVLSPGMSKERLSAILEKAPLFVYVTSRRGITGNAYAGTKELGQFIQAVKAQSDAQLMIGFGISTPQDVADALKLGDVAVVGSAIIKHLQGSNVAKTLDYIGTLAGAAV